MAYTGTIYIDDSKNINYGRECDLCGEAFNVDIYEARTICPRCRDVWKWVLKLHYLNKECDK